MRLALSSRWLQIVWIRERFVPGSRLAYHDGRLGEWKPANFTFPPIETKVCESTLSEAWEVVCQYADHDIPDDKETEPPVSRCENCIHFSEKTLIGFGTCWHEDPGTCHWHTPEPTWRDSRCSHFTPKGESDATSTQFA